MPGSDDADGSGQARARVAPPPAMVLAAGLGTRLRPLTHVRAKPAVPVNGRPLVRRILTWLAGHGIVDAVVNLHHRPATVAAVIGDGSDLGLRVRYSWEQPILGSAGGPRQALPLLTDGHGGPFLIVNGDTLSTVDVTALLDRHAASGAAVTMALIANPAPAKYGGVTVSRDGFVTGFTRAGTPGDSFHFVGVQVADARAFEALAAGIPAESVNALYPRLLAADTGAIAAFVSGASFDDIGTPRDYLATSLALADLEGPALVSTRSEIDDTAAIERTVVWDDVAIGRHTRLTECIVADGVRLPHGASYERSVIVRHDGAAPAADERVNDGLLIRPIGIGISR
jgi:NDP-sugar pyrophosphorylase family protein